MWIFVFILEDLYCVSLNENVNGLFQVHAMTSSFFCCARSHHYLKLPVQFKPMSAGRYAGLLHIQSETSGSLLIQLTSDMLP